MLVECYDSKGAAVYELIIKQVTHDLQINRSIKDMRVFIDPREPVFIIAVMVAKTTQPVLIEDKKVLEIGSKHNKTATQILLRWGIQRNTIVIPKSLSPEHLKINIGVFDFQLSEQEMNELAALDKGLRYVEPYNWWKIPYFD